MFRTDERSVYEVLAGLWGLWMRHSVAKFLYTLPMLCASGVVPWLSKGEFSPFGRDANLSAAWTLFGPDHAMPSCVLVGVNRTRPVNRRNVRFDVQSAKHLIAGAQSKEQNAQTARSGTLPRYWRVATTEF